MKKTANTIDQRHTYRAAMVLLLFCVFGHAGHAQTQTGAAALSHSTGAGGGALPNGLGQAPVAVDLSGYYNQIGIYNDGATFSGGLDGSGNSLSGTLLGSIQSWNGVGFSIGPAGSNDVVSCSGQTITLPSAWFSALQILALTEYGPETAQPFSVVYADGTSTSIIQNMSDWTGPQNYTGESVAVTMGYRNQSDGTKDNSNVYIYGYSIHLNTAVAVQSLILPNTANVKLISATLVSVPVAPTGLAAVAGHGLVSLTWNASLGATSYNVYRGSTSAGEHSVPVATHISTTSYTNTGLTAGRTYYYAVTAVNSLGTSGYSNETSASPLVGAPADLTATAGDSEIRLTWEADPTATSYNVYGSTVTGPWSVIVSGIKSTSITFTGLSNGRTYSFWLKAVNSTGLSPFSKEERAAPEPGATSFDYSAGFNSNGMRFNGTATLDGTKLRLTDGGQYEVATAFYTTKVDVSSFTINFTFQLTNATADGFTFVLQNNADTILNKTADGGYLGYLGIGHSVAVKFDLYSNSGEGSDSTGLYLDGASPTVPSINLSSTGIKLHSGDIIGVVIRYTGTTLTVTETDMKTKATATQKYQVDIPYVIGWNTAYAGFTAASGGLSAVQDILTWTLSSSNN